MIYQYFGCVISGRALSPAGTNESVVLVVSIILGRSGFFPVLLQEEGVQESVSVPLFLLSESGHAGQDALAWDTSGNPELSFLAVLLCNDHALGVLHLSANDEAVEVHAGLQFPGLEDEFALGFCQIVQGDFLAVGLVDADTGVGRAVRQLVTDAGLSRGRVGDVLEEPA